MIKALALVLMEPVIVTLPAFHVAEAQIRALEETLQEFDRHALQVRETDALVDPQAFDLVKHR